MKEKEDRLDKRVVLNNIREGVVDRKEYDKFLNSLPDVSNKAVEVSIEDIAPRAYLNAVGGGGTSGNDSKEKPETDRDPEK